MNLKYRPHAMIEDLAVGECTIRRTQSTDGNTVYPALWFNVLRETDGVAEDFEVPVTPGGAATESGTGGRTWGMTLTAPGTWEVTPSINVLETREIHPGEHPTLGSLWHQYVTIVGAPAGEWWA